MKSIRNQPVLLTVFSFFQEKFKLHKEKCWTTLKKPYIAPKGGRSGKCLFSNPKSRMKFGFRIH